MNRPLTPKERLKQVAAMDCRLKLEREKLERLRAAVEYRSPSFEGAGGGSDKSDAVSRLIEMEQRYDKLAAEYIALYDETDTLIKAVDGGVLSEVLERRYLLYQQWTDIAEAMNYTVRHITRLHGEALKKMSINVLECP